MKIRTGFVSNSSSSSFCFIGIKTTIDDINPNSFKGKGAEYLVMFPEFEGGEGQSAFFLTDKESLDYVKKMGHTGDVYQVLKSSYDGQDVDVSGLVIPRNSHAILTSFTIDNFSPSDLEGIKELYDYAGIDEEDDMTFIRLENTRNGHYKFYELKKIDDDEWEASYGRIDGTPTYRKYPMSRWNEKLNEKLNEGYIQTESGYD